MARNHALTLTFDGGSLGNPGQAYGSFRLKLADGISLPPKRLRFGHGTNNQAEYQALVAGLQAALAWARSSNLDPRSLAIEVQGDSQLVLNQLSGEWKVKDPQLRLLHHRARALIERFGEVRLAHQPRSRIVRVLGH